jgi:hypothetical protein
MAPFVGANHMKIRGLHEYAMGAERNFLQVMI